VANFHRAIVGDDLVGQALGDFELLSTYLLRREVDGAAFVAHVERYGGKAEEPLESRRNHMLAGMLLHVIAAAGGIDFAANWYARPQPTGRTIDKMQHFAGLFLFLNVDDADARAVGNRVDLSGVRVLPAAGGIEGRTVQHY